MFLGIVKSFSLGTKRVQEVACVFSSTHKRNINSENTYEVRLLIGLCEVCCSVLI